MKGIHNSDFELYGAERGTDRHIIAGSYLRSLKFRLGAWKRSELEV